MGENTKIEWCDFTFNGWLGCTKVSDGCTNCYAERFGKRFGIAWGAGQPRKRTSAANWREPIKWNAQAEREGRRYRVFCASLADVFDNEVPAEWRDDLFTLISDTPNLDWQLLTKRIGNAHRMLASWFEGVPAIWLGATICNQEEADRDIPKLLSTPAAVRFLSIEPMLSPIDLRRHIGGSSDVDDDEGGPHCDRCGCLYEDDDHECPEGFGPRPDWVIVGGESGPQARPTNIEWIRSIVQQCKAAGVPVFVKQIGALIDGAGFAPNFRLDDPKGGDPSEWPDDLRVRQFPR